MVQRNVGFSRLVSGYLFPEINRRKAEFLQKNPGAKLSVLGIGNTTEPLTPISMLLFQNAARNLGTVEGYSGYGDEQGNSELRAKIASVLYKGKVKPEEVFVSDGQSATSDVFKSCSDLRHRSPFKILRIRYTSMAE